MNQTFDAARDFYLQPPEFTEIRDAAANAGGQLVRTPLFESERVNRIIGGRLLLKAEGLQRTGSFKARGALNFIAGLPTANRARGVVAYSSGNHGQAVSWAASRLGIPALVIMPETAPAAKVERARGWGAEVRLIDWRAVDAKSLCQSIAAERGMTMVSPFEDRRIIAGAGTLAMEVVEQAAEMRAPEPDAMLIGCSGGGLLAGCAIAAHALSPQTEMWGVEPAGFDDLARSLAARERLANEPGHSSICDALTARTMGDLTFSIAFRHVRGAVSVSDDEVMQAMRLAFEEFRIVVEPGGAAALAAAMFGRVPVAGRTVAVVASGSNVDAELYRRALEI
ncbi:threonine/serine dehydratase [uncultured Bosea sp.]|uniref:threonine ammonia-lyase n=1 Tax=uncultured Bosea sp. TaxID=211457 RepID=UPI0025FDDAE7|nr:threonine/serine dehydratase [uncultured Bosea sp.]